ncbi:DNA-binding protein [Christiangramia fulva]|uniref:DNA-binding protein n=1 Tax=Christiangramia fulva TaxID=2126553 RepID=A0A2R3Z1W1_9FLAO|nr:helix-turn-helix domain-containing protein [Christiangramia fulva]AVR44229.1 DNA-binding protein [Christiangramia fulva]
MPTSIITTEDLQAFKEEMLTEIEAMLSKQQGGFTKKWLKSTEVMELLKISPGTLQNFRVNGTLPYTKIGGIIYYEASDIQEVLTANKIHHNF